MPRLGFTLALITLLLAAASPTHAQTGVVRGIVSDDADRPVPGARVSVVGTSLATESRVDGTFELGAVPTGRQSRNVIAPESPREAMHTDPLSCCPLQMR